jgi:hypothetical protein
MNGEGSSTAVGDDDIEEIKARSRKSRKRTPLKRGRGNTKTWNTIFSTSRPPKKSEIWVESKRKLHADGDGIDLFFRDTKGTSAWRHFDEVDNFCNGVELANLASGRGDAGNKCNIWLDARGFSHETRGGDVREYPNPLTAKSLYNRLKEDRTEMDRTLM